MRSLLLAAIKVDRWNKSKFGRTSVLNQRLSSAYGFLAGISGILVRSCAATMPVLPDQYRAARNMAVAVGMGRLMEGRQVKR